jgi:hypothetical protein
MPQLEAASVALPTAAWQTAKLRFMEGLSDDEQALFENATLENLFYGASVAFKKHEKGNKLRAVQLKLQPLIDGIEGYGKALDVFAQTSSLVLCPLWGSIRVVLHVGTDLYSLSASYPDGISYRLRMILENISTS